MCAKLQQTNSINVNVIEYNMPLLGPIQNQSNTVANINGSLQQTIINLGPSTSKQFVPAPTLIPTTIRKYINQLVIPPIYEPIIVTDPITGEVSHNYTVDVTEFDQQILPASFPATRVWGYGGMVKNAADEIIYFRHTPGATFQAVKGIPTNVTWENKLTGPHLFAVDPTLHWANPNNMPMMPPKPWPIFPPGFPAAQSPVPIVTHLHGGEVRSDSDGNPDAWITADGKTGPAFPQLPFNYPNKQLPTTLWYHDHALGITRLNVMAGLAGFYLLRDPEDSIAPILPSGKYEVPLAIQDRSFKLDGSLFFDSMGNNPNIHPYWTPEFIGNTIMVNGVVWPNFNVERRQYRFRILNGSNARFYNLSLSNNQTFIQIGSDGGYLPKPVTLKSILLAPGERADLLINFSTVAPSTKIIILNSAKTPFPQGTTADPQTVGQIMQFTVLNTTPVTPNTLPGTLNTIPVLAQDANTRTLTLNEVIGPGGPTQLLLNGQQWDAAVSELPRVGSTEVWELVNLTADTHPIHLHLVQFQLLSRQAIQVNQYTRAWNFANEGGVLPLTNPTVTVPVAPYLQGKPRIPAPNEMGWKDTIQANPGEVTRIIVRFAPQDANPALVKPGVNLYPFDPTIGPGYVWHCHILDHEDNEMMRPYIVQK